MPSTEEQSKQDGKKRKRRKRGGGYFKAILSLLVILILVLLSMTLVNNFDQIVGRRDYTITAKVRDGEAYVLIDHNEERHYVDSKSYDIAIIGRRYYIYQGQYYSYIEDPDKRGLGSLFK